MSGDAWAMAAALVLFLAFGFWSHLVDKIVVKLGEILARGVSRWD